jgi:hypothetical protein
MTKRVFRNCSILVLSLAAMQMAASAQETPGLDGTWLANITPVDCHTGAIIANAVPFLGLYMFGHDGSLTNEAAFLVSNPPRSSGLGTWQHTQGHTYVSTFRFFRYNPDGSFLSRRDVTFTILLNGDTYTSSDKFQDFDANNRPLPAMGCNIETGARLH